MSANTTDDPYMFLPRIDVELQDAVEQLHLIRYTHVATLVLLVYEYLITFNDEKRLVWPSKLSAIKVVFILNRYLPFVITAGLTYVTVFADVKYDHSICKPGFLIFGSLVILNYIIAESILYIRAYAAWGGIRVIGIVLFCTLLGVVAIATTYIARFFKSVEVINTFPISNGCVFEFRDQVAWISMITLIVSETFALAVLLARAPRLAQSKVMKMLIADGIFYYVFILLSSLANTVVLRLAPSTLCAFLIATQGALHSIFCNRLLLNIRGAYQKVAVVCTLGEGATEIYALESLETVSEFQVASRLTLRSHVDTDARYEEDFSDEEE